MQTDKLKSRIEGLKVKMQEDERMFKSLSPSTYGWDDSICPPSCPEDRDIEYIVRHYQRLRNKLLRYENKLLGLSQNAS